MNISPLTNITSEHKEAYQRDGVVMIKGAFDSDWVDLVHSGWERIRKSTPKELYNMPDTFLENDPRLSDEIQTCKNDGINRQVYTEQSEGFLRYKYMRWWAPEFRKFMLESPAAELVGRVIGSDCIRVFVDALFAKAANCQTRTYWHADQPAWPVRGSHIPTMWMAVLPVYSDLSSLEYVVGSHKLASTVDAWPNTYNAKTMERPHNRTSFYDWEKRRGDPSVRFVSYDMDPGDVVILHANTYHGGGPNLHPTQPRVALSTRWFGTDVVWDPRPECLNIPGMPFERMVRGRPVSDDEIFPIVWSKLNSPQT
jgi:ectoine hydroxylase-related dioxygenase (phytanoyl-CoA dioxygenase family)